MKKMISVAVVLVAGLFTVLPPALGNSEIFPATEAAKGAVNWKNGYFQINGKPTFITAGELHYARIPRELWRDRLWRVKQMGFNCIQMYVFWNAHESREGQWDFSDNLDLDAWLSLIQELGMYAIVRVGPYSCAEWEQGGFPAWLTVKPGVTLRDMNDIYNRYADEHLAKIYEIVKKHQIHKGGNVIMAQLENEHPRGWGTDPNPYLMHLYRNAREAGLEIPLFFSGLRHAPDPSGESPFRPGTSPWFSTEFWTGWIGKYGDMDAKMLNQKVRGTWKIIAFGGAGYGYYVVHGGSNFGYSGDTREVSYDYSASIGEAGQFHNLYAPARRAAMFAQAFSGLLTASTNGPSFAKATVGGRVTTRTSPYGSIVFADNFLTPADKNKAAKHIAPTAEAYQVEKSDPGRVAIVTRLQVAGRGEFPQRGDLVLHPDDIRTVLFDLPWTAHCRFESVAANVLLRQDLDGCDTWVCYGWPGDHGEVTLKRDKAGSLPLTYAFTYPKEAKVQEIMVDSGDGPKARFLVMNTELADQTWYVKNKLLVGVPFVREDGVAELPMSGGKWSQYQGAGKEEKSCAETATPPLPELTGWKWRDAAREKSVAYDDSRWLTSQGPNPMETYDSFQNRYGWYRTTITSGNAPLNLHLAGFSGDLQVYLNGKPADLKSLPVVAGDNNLAIFVKAAPRSKLYNFIKQPGLDLARGIWGGVVTRAEPLLTITEWKILGTTNTTMEAGLAFVKPDFDDQAWSTIHADASRKDQPELPGSYWLRKIIEIPVESKYVVAGLPKRSSGSLALFVNETRVPLSTEQRGDVDLTPFLKTGRNCIAMHLVLNRPDNGKVVLMPEFKLWQAYAPVTWKFRGGLENLEETQVVGRVLNWERFIKGPWCADAPAAEKLPKFWMTTFEYRPKYWETIGLSTAGLKSGHVWLNGHNLGESPQKVLMYLPECWLKDGANELVVFDAQGAKPGGLKLQRYEIRQADARK